MTARQRPPADYAELCVTSNFTFLTGASHPEELVTRAAELGLSAIAITDRNSLAGVVRAHSALRELARMRAEEREAQVKVRSHVRIDPSSRQDYGTAMDEVGQVAPRPGATWAKGSPAPSSRRITAASAARIESAQRPAATQAAPSSSPEAKTPPAPACLPVAQPGDAPASATLPPDPPLPRLIVGARLVLTESPVHWVALPTDRAAYARLSRLLSLGKRRAPKGECHLTRADLLAGAEGLMLIALPQTEGGLADIQRVARRCPGRTFLGAAPRYDGQDQPRFDRLATLSQQCGAPLVAMGDVLMHRAARRRLADVLTCLREGITIDRIGRRALPNAERRLKSPAEMARLFRRYPAALRRTLEIADRCAFSLSELSYEYPDEEDGVETPQARLERLTEEGLRDTARFPDGISPRTRGKVDKELRLIAEMNYAPYFLTVHDIIAFARSKGILCQGRGSAANSVVCYALGVTEVHPDRINMVFERFISRERGEPPDIDVDFEHERREEVIQHIYNRYGRERAGLTATVIHFRTRSAIREVGKVMGLSQDIVAAIAGLTWGWSSSAPDPAKLREIGLDPDDRRLAQTLRLIAEITGFPRHLSQHVGGFVITRGRLDELCPIENAAMEDRTIIEWDKDDIDALGILKVDVLALGMLTCVRKGLDLLRDHARIDLTLPTIPPEDPVVYDMLCRADAVGVFQVESRAQMNFLPRMRPREFYDLVIEVAIVRPGPIQGGMVHPYIKRRQGLEPIEDLGPDLNALLGKTYGVPLFQEQAMQIAVIGAGFNPGEADRLRRSLATFRRMGTIGTFRERFLQGMLANGYDEAFASRCFDQIEGFGEYGFPESHAASFAILVYASAWMKCHHPAVFGCALLNSQPMGFYAPAQIVRDLRDHGVEVRPVSVNHSAWDNTLEHRTDGSLALRIGFRQVKGLREEDAAWIVAARGNGYSDVESVWRRSGAPPAALERLAEADAFAAIGLARRDALWQVRAIRGPAPLPLFATSYDGEGIDEPSVALPTMTLGEAVVEDYLALRLSLRAHPMELLRPRLPGLVPHAALPDQRPGRRITVCGLVITRQRPGTASGVIFLTLEDETGVSNVVVWTRVYERFRRAVLGGRLLRVTGPIQREGAVIHLIAEEIEDVSPQLALMGHVAGPLIDPTEGRADEARRPVQGRTTPRAYHPREQAKALFPSRDFH
jgi:error-prone DNA polymerase